MRRRVRHGLAAMLQLKNDARMTESGGPGKARSTGTRLSRSTSTSCEVSPVIENFFALAFNFQRKEAGAGEEDLSNPAAAFPRFSAHPTRLLNFGEILFDAGDVLSREDVLKIVQSYKSSSVYGYAGTSSDGATSICPDFRGHGRFFAVLKYSRTEGAGAKSDYSRRKH